MDYDFYKDMSVPDLALLVGTLIGIIEEKHREQSSELRAKTQSLEDLKQCVNNAAEH